MRETNKPVGQQKRLSYMKKSDRKVELYTPYKLQNKNYTTLMIAEKVSRDKEVDRKVEWEQKADQSGEELLEIENQS